MSAVLQLIRQRFSPSPAGEIDQKTSSMIRAIPGSSHLVLDSPHSGTDYPADFSPSCDMDVLRRAEDTHVDRLYAFAPALGIAWVEALFPRSYLDVNRSLHEIDPHLLAAPWPIPTSMDAGMLSKVKLGKGLIWRCTDDGTPIYSRKLTEREVFGRIDRCWTPYHAAVAEAIECAHARHGYSIHVNCHSMPSVADRFATDFPGLEHSDFVVGNRDETTSSAALGQAICAHLRSLGFSVSYNHPYKGAELVRRYSDPASHRHSVQLEINRRLYMNELTLEISSSFGILQEALLSLIELLLRTDTRSMP